MRGDDRQPDAMFSYVSMETRIPPEHPRRAMRILVDAVLRDISSVLPTSLFNRNGNADLAGNDKQFACNRSLRRHRKTAMLQLACLPKP